LSGIQDQVEIWHCPSALAQAQPPQPKPATTHTIDFNKTSTAGYPWSDTADFRNAKRGFIAPLPNNGVIKGKDGQRSLQVRVHQAG
jgi:alkyl sulfatase BDS1-like metallo-beta-lactamase superfamily hydrolase